MSPCYQPTPRGPSIMDVTANALQPHLSPREARRFAIDILGRIMGRCQAGWYWSTTDELKAWYIAGEWKIREVHDALCRAQYGTKGVN